MKNIDSKLHCTGESLYIDDIPETSGTLFGQVFYAPIAHAKNISLNFEKAMQQPGVVRILSAKDIPGSNQIGAIILDEPLFADDTIHYWGQPLALVVAKTQRQARLALKEIKATWEALPVVTSPREAHKKEQYLTKPCEFQRGDASIWHDCAYIVSGQADSGGQEHLYLEPQGAMAEWSEDGGLRIVSSTQAPTAVQKCVARVLAYPMHRIEVDVKRLGGGFGGKEDQATPWAVMAALAAWHLKKPVKIVLQRHDDMVMTGKRHPYQYDFRIGLAKDGQILAWEVSFFQNGGAAADLSPAVISRSLFHAANAYYIPYVRAKGYCCRTNLPPNTAFRGFGAPQGVFSIESAIRLASEKTGLDVLQIQKNSLMREGDEFHYGQKAVSCKANSSFMQCIETYLTEARLEEIRQFNKSNDLYSKGLSVLPICFGISFTKTEMNQASALVHLYQDGSISVSTAAIEMGQGVNTKIVQMVHKILGIAPEKVQILSTNTSRVANTSPTAASSGADLNGRATEKACRDFKSRLSKFLASQLNCDLDHISFNEHGALLNGKGCQWSWPSIAERAWQARIPLTSHQHYATPELHFDNKSNKGHPFSYHVYGCAVTEVTVDLVRGRYEIDAVDIVHDFGKSMNPDIDKGQVEGALMQGIGWVTLEDLQFSETGKPMSETLSTYKVPDIYCAPKRVTVTFLENTSNPFDGFVSKAVGEPPLIYGLGAFFALREAIKAAGTGKSIPFSSPMTPEKVLMNLYPSAFEVGTSGEK